MPLKTVQINARMGEGMKVECRARQHVIFTDQPQKAGGTDSAPTPLELYEMALGACFASLAKTIARQRGIELRAFNVTVSGELNTDVLLGKNKEERAGVRSFTMAVELDANLSREEKMAFLEEVERRCPVSDNTSNPTGVRVTLA